MKSLLSRLRFAIAALALLCSVSAVAHDYAMADSAVVDTISAPHAKWYRQLIDNGFHINDPDINYPRFWRWCVDVYNWGDRTFNSYDPDYVVGAGKNWKAGLKSYNWTENYTLLFPHKLRVNMVSDIFSDVGAYLSFMAVSVGYTLNANDVFGHPVANHHNFDFNFCCALFSANLNLASTSGGTRITRFGDYNKGEHLSQRFDDVSLSSVGGDIYYFFNHSRYSQAAAYCYSKYQLRSAGSWIAGAAVTHQKIDIDFSGLPEDMLEKLPGDYEKYRFHYTDYGLIGGYAYNWVLHPKRWLINATILPSIGYRHSYEGATEGRKDMFSTNVRAMMSVVYNHRSLYASLVGRYDGHIYYKSAYTFVNSNNSVTFNVGFRF